MTPLLVPPPPRVVWWLRPALWMTRRMTGKDPLPARLLAWFPKGALGAGVFEITAAHGPGDLDARVLAAARIVASAVAGCPFCVDMNAANWKSAGLTVPELEALLALDAAKWEALGAREAAAARYADALSRTPIAVAEELRVALTSVFSPRELVVLATTIAQVNYWSRFNQGLGVPSAGFLDESACRVPERLRG